MSFNNMPNPFGDKLYQNDIYRKWERKVYYLMFSKSNLLDKMGICPSLNIRKYPLQIIDDYTDLVLREHSRGDKFIKCYFEEIGQVTLDPYEQFILDFDCKTASTKDWKKLAKMINTFDGIKSAPIWFPNAKSSPKIKSNSNIIRRIYDYFGQIFRR